MIVFPVCFLQIFPYLISCHLPLISDLLALGCWSLLVLPFLWQFLLGLNSFTHSQACLVIQILLGRIPTKLQLLPVGGDSLYKFIPQTVLHVGPLHCTSPAYPTADQIAPLRRSTSRSSSTFPNGSPVSSPKKIYCYFCDSSLYSCHHLGLLVAQTLGEILDSTFFLALNSCQGRMHLHFNPLVYTHCRLHVLQQDFPLPCC